jgi:NTP pyrophosphatase (non-canonical NTP hydrolase)
MCSALEFERELGRARKKFPPMASAHEGYAVILEEVDELWEIIKQKQSDRDYVHLRKETVQLGAMVLAFLQEIVDVENRR